MRSQQELERIWEDIHQGAYGNDSSDSKPMIVVEDETEHVMSIPNINGIDIKSSGATGGNLGKSFPMSARSNHSYMCHAVGRNPYCAGCFNLSFSSSSINKKPLAGE